MTEVLILSIVQGITEFIPVSSSSHLVILTKLMNFSGGVLLDISVHIGSFFAVIIYFRKDLIDYSKNLKILSLFLIASIPVILSGYLLTKYNLVNNLRTLEIIGWATILFGILLYISDKIKVKNEFEKNFDVSVAFKIGLLQCFSLIPGVGRSGIVITASRFLKFDRIDSAKISFLLSIPTLLAVSCYGFFKMIQEGKSIQNEINYLSIILSFIFSYLTIKYLLLYLKKFSLNFFVIYRIILGIILLSTIYIY